jgi:nucleotide-binding universal stress UspA family protein
MAASRINLAMSRDSMIPHWLSKIHPKRLTPYRAILFTGGLALIFLLIDSLETLAEIASVLQLYSYAALNIGMVVLRVAAPDWYKPSFRVPGTPFVQLFAALGCVAIILFSGVVAQIVILVLILVSLSWYFLWGKKRVDIRYGLPLFRERWSQLGWQAFSRPTVAPALPTPTIARPSVRLIDAVHPRRVMVALANPQHETDLLRLGRYLATGEETGGAVFGIHLVQVPLQTPLEIARDRFAQRPSIKHTIAALGEQTRKVDEALNGKTRSRRPIASTEITAVTDVAHDVFGSLIAETLQRQADLLLMGWQGGFNVSHIYNSPVQRIITSTPADVAVLKNRGLEKIDSILIPWGGGPHAQLGLEFAVRVGESTGADIHLQRIVKPGVDIAREREALRTSVGTIVGGYTQMHYDIHQGEDVAETLQTVLDSETYDLIIIGASHEWRIRNFLFGSIPDIIADHAQCSVLMVRRYLLER